QPYSPPAPGLPAAAVQAGFGDRAASTREMSKAEIRASMDATRQSTANLLAAGFDGVMLHASHGGIIEQFNSPYFNRRTDEYGGSLENRMRFMIESLQAAHQGAQGKMAIGLRLNCNELLPGGYEEEDAREIL